MVVSEGVIVGLAKNVGHTGLFILHAEEGRSDEGQQPHHSQQISTSRVIGLVLFGSLELFVVSCVVHDNI